MTSDLVARVDAHRRGRVDGFTRKYRVTMLVYHEHHDTVEAATTRGRQMKKWRRQWKLQLIEQSNPTWRDLFAEICG
jgi:putative endonuclease